MSRRFGRLPPLTALEGFESAARLRSFSLAAEELSITQSAISHQIRALENFFEEPLFNRVGRSVELTVPGMDFLDTVTRVLGVLARGKRRIDFYNRPGAVVWGTTAAFAGKWLLPRYDKMRQWFPQIQPWLFTTDEFYELEAQEVDLGIWYGDGHWSHVDARKLFHDRLTPLYAPEKFTVDAKLDAVEDLENYTLLHDERPDDWLSWFQKVNYSEHDSVTGCNFSDPGLMLESAVAGQGIALGSLILANSLISEGKLTKPFEEVVVTRDAYYLVTLPGQTFRPAVASARDWLLKEVREFSEMMGFEEEP